jgi:hypothetical protein
MTITTQDRQREHHVKALGYAPNVGAHNNASATIAIVLSAGISLLD